MKQSKDQIIRVNTKKGLLAGFECAKDFPETTKITLVRKTGETIYELRPYNFEIYKDLVHPQLNNYYQKKCYPGSKYSFNQFIEKAKIKIKRTKATDLLA